MDDTKIDDQGFSILFESVVFDGGQILSEDSNFSPPLGDIIRTAILDAGDGHTTTKTAETIGILLEDSEASGFFKQEDESTVSTTYGDDILLESATGYGITEKLLLDHTVIELEDQDQTGTIPFQNYSNTTFDNIITSADITTDEGLGLALEDSTGPDHIILNGTDDNTANAGFFLLEESRGDQMLLESIERDFTDQSGLVVLNGTDSDSTNAGENVRLQNATNRDVLNNSAFEVIGVPKFSSSNVTLDSSIDMSAI